MKKILLILLFINLSLFAQKKVITVTIEPQKYIVEKITKNHMKVRSIYKGSEFDIRFKKLELKEIAASDIYMTIGLKELEQPFKEQALLYNKDLEIFDMSQDVMKRTFFEKENPYIWLDPLNVREMAKTVFMRIVDMDPSNRTLYRENYDNFVQELDDLYVKIKLHFSNYIFGVYRFDGNWDYFLSRFDFQFYKVDKHILHANDISSFIDKSTARKAKVLLIDPTTSIRVAQSIANNANSKIVESDIYKYSFLGDMILLSEKMTR